MTICYFTATGNSLYVAKRIGGEMSKMVRGLLCLSSQLPEERDPSEE